MLVVVKKVRVGRIHDGIEWLMPPLQNKTYYSFGGAVSVPATRSMNLHSIGFAKTWGLRPRYLSWPCLRVLLQGSYCPRNVRNVAFLLLVSPWLLITPPAISSPKKEQK